MFNKLKNILNKGNIKTIPLDNYIKRLRSLVIGEGMLEEGNIYLIDYALKNMPSNGVVLEIGSYGGLSTNLILYLMDKYQRSEKVLSCDPWIYQGYDYMSKKPSSTIDGRMDISRADYSTYIKESFIKGIKFLSNQNLPYSFELTSNHFFEKYDQKSIMQDVFGRKLRLGDSISFAYIDGNHAYNFVKSDFENVNNYLQIDGLILFDDSKDGLKFGSAEFMTDMLQNPNYKLIDKNPNYLFKKVS